MTERVRSAIAIGQEMERLTLETGDLEADLLTEGHLARQTAEWTLAALGVVAGHRRIPVDRTSVEIAQLKGTCRHIAMNVVEVAQETGVHHHVTQLTAAGRL
jgi:hypothetical protein